MNHVRSSITLTTSLALIFFLGCTKADEQDRDNTAGNLTHPIAGFSYTGNDKPAPVTIEFTNTSEYADRFEWNFGDGYTSAEVNPVHTFHNGTNEPKSYLVTLKATDSGSGLSNTRAQSVKILPSK